MAIVSAMLFMTSPSLAGDSAELVGRWYAEGVEHGIYAQIIEDHHGDGTFWLEVRTTEICGNEKFWIETGTWSYVDGAIVKWTKTVAGLPVPDVEYYRDRFVMMPIDSNHIELFDVKTRITWSHMRVGPEFKFPPAAACAES